MRANMDSKAFSYPSRKCAFGNISEHPTFNDLTSNPVYFAPGQEFPPHVFNLLTGRRRTINPFKQLLKKRSEYANLSNALRTLYRRIRSEPAIHFFDTGAEGMPATG
jgi:hypothetical protein